MKILIAHLTRMTEGYVCAAGIDLDTGKNVRPVLARAERCGMNMLATFGGPFDIAQVIEINKVKPAGRPPELEDYLFSPRDTKVVSSLGGVAFWKHLEKAAKPKLAEIFGKVLVQKGKTSAIVEPFKGEASLGFIVPTLPVKMYMRRGKDDKLLVRMKLKDESFDLDLSVTDLRLYKFDYSPDTRVVMNLARRLENCAGVILGMGLTRPFSKGKGAPSLHYLQVNNIHLVENPAWRLK